MPLPRPSPLQHLPSEELEGVDEATWLDVIHKMDEVYSKLVADEVELEEKNAQLEQSQQFIFSLLSAMKSGLAAKGLGVCRNPGTTTPTYPKTIGC